MCGARYGVCGSQCERSASFRLACMASSEGSDDGFDGAWEEAGWDEEEEEEVRHLPTTPSARELIDVFLTDRPRR